jgi:hypothetical protein
MFVYALTEPIDIFDGLAPLPEWIIKDPVPRTRWALQAMLALADTSTQVRWDGDMRHLPSVGATLTHPAPAATSWSSRTTTAQRSSSPTANYPCPQVSSNTAPKSASGASALGHIQPLAEIDAATLDHRRIDATTPDLADHAGDPPF